MPRKKKVLSIRALFLACSFSLYGTGSLEPECTVGNFALPVSQQLGPLISFGQNIIYENEVQLYLFADDFIGRKNHFIDLAPSVLYGITDTLSLFAAIPFALRYRDHHQRSSGIEDASFQLEWVFFATQSACTTHQATVVFNTSFPTGSSHKDPPTGYGALTFFLGGTYNYTTKNWYCFTSYGARLPATSRFGNEYLYQAGIGRFIANPEGWILACLLEADGTFTAQGKTNPDSGGNTIYLTPSFWASSDTWILQLGAGYAIQQNLFGDQSRNGYLIALNIGWTL